MERIYFDNAATTKIAPEVLEVMLPYLSEVYGNPSSTHTTGRQAKAGIVQSRKKISALLNCDPGEIVFTSGGTEADNMAIACAVKDLNVKRIISSEIEHKAVLETSKEWEDKGVVKVEYLRLDERGYPDLGHLEELLKEDIPTLVSLMHGNNELGTLIDLQQVGNLCKQYNAFFHSDTVQTMNHYRFDLKNTPVDFITGSAHKFHGPKGCGFVYVSKDLKVKPMIIGGGQERNLRAGTENVASIVGMARAMELGHEEMEEHHEHISSLKQKMRSALVENVPGVEFNGDSTENGLYTVLSASLPSSEVKDMFLFSLDIQGVCASGGSACNSGANKGSHVLTAMGVDPDRINVRFSFGRYNTEQEVDKAIAAVKSILSLN